MLFKHCNRQFKHLDVWFLQDKKDFTERKLYIFICPKCQKLFTTLCQVNKNSMKKFYTTDVGAKAKRTLDIEALSLSVKASDIKIKKGKPVNNWIYGENKQMADGTVKQIAVDFYNQKQVVKITSTIK